MVALAVLASLAVGLSCAEPKGYTSAVIEIIDGDTFDVARPGEQPERIRLLGIDTPETFSANEPNEYGDITDTVCLDRWGKVATQAAIDALKGKQVFIEPDPRAPERDTFGRILAYVYVEDSDFSEALLEAGLARVYTEGDSSRINKYLQVQAQAQAQGVGLWSCAGGESSAMKPSTVPGGDCDPSYPDVCIAPGPPDLDCGDIPFREFRVVGRDPHKFDMDKDGLGCEGPVIQLTPAPVTPTLVPALLSESEAAIAVRNFLLDEISKIRLPEKRAAFDNEVSQAEFVAEYEGGGVWTVMGIGIINLSSTRIDFVPDSGRWTLREASLSVAPLNPQAKALVKFLQSWSDVVPTPSPSLSISQARNALVDYLMGCVNQFVNDSTRSGWERIIRDSRIVVGKAVRSGGTYDWFLTGPGLKYADQGDLVVVSGSWIVSETEPTKIVANSAASELLMDHLRQFNVNVRCRDRW